MATPPNADDAAPTSCPRGLSGDAEDGPKSAQGGAPSPERDTKEVNQIGSDDRPGQTPPSETTGDTQAQGNTQPTDTPTILLDEIRALRERLSQLETQATTTLQAPADALFASAMSTHDKEKRARKRMQRARMAKRQIAKMEQRAEATADSRKHLGGEGECDALSARYLMYIGPEGETMSSGPDSEVAIHSTSEEALWRDVVPKPHRSIRLPRQLRAKDSLKLGPATKWDTSDSDQWSNTSSVASRDFSYFRARLRGDFEWELDRLNHQKQRYKRYKERKAAKALEETMKAQEEARRAEQHAEKEKEKEKESTMTGDGVAKDGDASETDPLHTPEPERLLTVERPKEQASEFGIPTLNPLDWQSFTAAKRLPTIASFAIDVLIGEPKIGRSTWPYHSARPKGHQAVAVAPKPEPVSKQHLTGQAPLPERIRIHSLQLIKVLSMIHGAELDTTPLGYSTVTMTRPFKMLAYYDKEIRAWHSKLKADRSDAATQSKSVSDVPPKHDENDMKPRERDDEENKVEDPENLSRSDTTLLHLPCLIEFLDEHIGKKQCFLSSPGCEKVSFSDIWHLFKPGEFVISADGKQVFRVVRVHSPPHKGTYPWAAYAEPRGKHAKPYVEDVTIYCVYIHFDGISLGPVLETFNIKKFDGEKSVTSLEIYPLRFHVLRDLEVRTAKNKQAPEFDNLFAAKVADLRQKLIERGKLFVEVTGVKHMYYSGLTVDTRDEIESQVMIDFEEAFAVERNKGWRPRVTSLLGGTIIGQDEEGLRDFKGCEADCCWGEAVHHDSTYVEDKRQRDFINSMMAEMEDNPRKLPSAAVFPRTLEDIKTEATPLTPDELLIMSNRVFGFVLRDRTWAQLDLTHLTDIVDSGGNDALGANESDEETDTDDDKSAFGRLVLPGGHKDMVLSLVSQHFRNKKNQQGKDEQVDIVRGKGKGLILLLHGAPGVGKTTTAEGVAEKFKKPLFQITCGDLGATAKDVELALQTNFALANRWDCILLLDEADVFLAERRQNDFNRNGLVAVFLRVLEYYAGILFLTTNRIGDFDEAFASRIHMSLHYPALDEISTIRVFKLNLGMIKKRYKESGRKLKIDEVKIFHMVGEFFRNHDKARWNGRQIRNACQTALALAEFDAQPPGRKYDLTQEANAKVYLRAEHLDKVSTAYLEFMEYLKAVHGTDADTHAKESGIRALETAIAALKAGKKAGSTVPTQQAAKPDNPLRTFKLPTKSASQGATAAPQNPEQSSQQQQHRDRPRTPQASQYSPRPAIAAPQTVNQHQQGMPQHHGYHQQQSSDPNHAQQQYLTPTYPSPYNQSHGSSHAQVHAQQQGYYQSPGPATAAFNPSAPPPIYPPDTDPRMGHGNYEVPQGGQGGHPDGSGGQ